MENNFQLGVLIVSIMLYVAIFTTLKKGRIPLKFGLVWLIPTTVIFLVSVIPNLFAWISHLVGFETISNIVIGILFVILIFICMALTIIVSGLKTKQTLLIQELSILKERVTDIENQ